MLFLNLASRRAAAALLLLALSGSFRPLNAAAQTNLNVRIMAANLTSGSSQSYETPGIDILQGLKPDVVAIQEFRYNGSSADADLRQLVNVAFGSDFYYYREPYTASGNIPNGIVSRWPIIASGSWDDPLISNRGFAWAKIRLPNSNDLYVVSVHLYSGGTAADRNTEATVIKTNVLAGFPIGAWVVVAGDFNTGSRTEAAVTTFKTFLSDSPIPSDQAGNPNTNEPRNNPYDYVLPSQTLVTNLVAVKIGGQSFANGLVFDSRLYSPLADVAPVKSSDSGASQMQHMAVIKDFNLGYTTNVVSSNAPVIVAQPQDRTVALSQDATFTVVATGSAPLRYQWKWFGTNLAGATASAYTRTNCQVAHAGAYSVTVSNDLGFTNSAEAQLTVVAQASGIIAQWDFNASSLSPSYGSGTAWYVGGTAAAGSGEFGSGSGSTDTAASNSSWITSTYPGITNANRTAGVQFNVSTAGRQNVVVRWDQRSSSTGTKYVRLQYTTNGTQFVDFSASAVSATTFVSVTNDLGAIPGVNNNPQFAFRIVAEFEKTATGSGTNAYVGAGSTYATGGTLRFDMVTVSGAAVVAPGFAAQPQSQTALAGSTVGFAANVTGTTPMNYQWQLAGTNLLSATNATLWLTNVTYAHSGSYVLQVANGGGTAASGPAILAVYAPPATMNPPLIANDQVQVSFSGLPGYKYALQRSFDLANWDWVATNVYPCSFTAPFSSLSPEGFYRVIPLP